MLGPLESLSVRVAFSSITGEYIEARSSAQLLFVKENWLSLIGSSPRNQRG